MKMKVQRTGKELRPTSVVTFMSQRREAVDEAYAGDIIGFTIHGGVQLGDSITDGPSLQFTGLPFFAPEMFMTVVLKNPLRTKQLQQGLMQLGEEGAIQVFKPDVGGNMLLGAVGQLQFEVVQHRLKTEYDCDVRLEGCQYTGARWITADPAELREFENAYPCAWRTMRPTPWPICAPAPMTCAWRRSVSQDPLPPAARAWAWPWVPRTDRRWYALHSPHLPGRCGLAIWIEL
jgi:peptide subunit release factor RF-3